MRIRWASSSQIAVPPSNAARQPHHPIPANVRAPAAQKKLAMPGHGLKRTRTQSRASLHDSIVMSKTVAAKKQKAKVIKDQKAGVGYSYVYVGNIDPIIRKEDLAAFFKHCGPVACIQVRCSRGQAVNAGIAVPKGARTGRDRQYATVEFSDSKAVLKAIKKNGSLLKGCPLVVTVSPADLPEVKDIVQSRLYKLRGQPDLHNSSVGSPRSILSEPTQEAITTPRTDRHRLFGVSFAKCIA